MLSMTSSNLAMDDHVIELWRITSWVLVTANVSDVIDPAWLMCNGWCAISEQSHLLQIVVADRSPVAAVVIEKEEAPVASTAPDPSIAVKIAGARKAVATGDWLEARKLFEEVILLDPQNPDALASLPLIERRLEEARGSVRVDTVPAGALVRLGTFKEQPSPAIFTGVPFGEHELSVSLEGHDPVSRQVKIESEEPLVLSGITLARSFGQIEVVSEPRGAEFKVVRNREQEPEELVEVGKTPAKIEQLDPGEYQVYMSVAGFPEQSQVVRVEHNRNTSVSAVFAKGGLNLTSDPAGAEVWLADGEDKSDKPRKAGVTPVSLANLPAGKHRIELRYGDWAPIRRTVEVSGPHLEEEGREVHEGFWR